MDWNGALARLNENAELVAVSVTIALAFVGYLINHASSVRRHRAEARLGFVSAQLERLYGPLYSLVEANTASWLAFRKSFRPNQPIFNKSKPFDEREKALWRAWAENVFIPSNLKIREVIERNAHLLVDGDMPDCFRRVIAHIESSKLVLPSLADGDLSVLDEFEGWPDDFNDFVADSFRAISREHAKLLGQARGRDLTRRLRVSPTPRTLR